MHFQSSNDAAFAALKYQYADVLGGALAALRRRAYRLTAVGSSRSRRATRLRSGPDL